MPISTSAMPPTAAFSTNVLSAAGIEAPAPAFMPWADEGALVVPVACAVAAPAATRKARPMLAERIDGRVFRGDMRCS